MLNGVDERTPDHPAEAVVLAVLDGDLAGNRVAARASLVVGRGEDVDFLLDDGEISRRHAVFRGDRGSLEVEDLGSLNGTWVNGNRINVPTKLAAGDIVKLGNTHLEVVHADARETRTIVDTSPAEDAVPLSPPPIEQTGEAATPSESGATPAGALAPSQARLITGVTGEDELRPVTALFADIVGSTSIGEQLPPEEVKTLVGECISRMTRVVEQYGGVIDAFMGDGIAAFFGVPTAHEDDTERAARTALRILEVVRAYAEEVRATWSLSNFNIRVGLNSGQVAVGLVGGSNRRPVALGDTMNVAARLQAAAEPGTIVAGGRTARELQGRFLVEPLGNITVKGRAAPVEAWRLVRAESELRATEPRPLVGRQYETERLGATMDALLTGRGQVILLTGEPGIGKTRLLEWFRGSARGNATWLEGHCASYGRELPYAPFVRILHRWLGLEEGESGSVVRSKLQAQLEVLLGSTLLDVLPYLASLLSVRAGRTSESRVEDIPPEHLAIEIERAFSSWARALCESGPLVIALEDFHWADQPTRKLAESLLNVVDSAPLVVATTFRIEPETEGWHFRVRALSDYPHRTGELRLAPLDEAESTQLLATLAPGKLDETAERELIARAEGNPLYLEHLLRLFLESGDLSPRRTWAMTVAGKLPSALESLLIARIDALQGDARRLIQIAAVLGRDFSLPILAAVAGTEGLQSTIGLLLREDIMRELRPLPDRAYTFTHGLLREAALSTLTRARRRELHRAIASALERLFDDSLDEHLEPLAFHNARAGDLPRALWYLERAAARATSLHAYTQAVELWRRASRIAAGVGDVDAQRRIDKRLWELTEGQR